MSNQAQEPTRRTFAGSWELFLGLFFGLVFAWFFYAGYFSDFENSLIDKRFQMRGSIPVSDDILLIIISDECINKIGPWPWPRQTHGRLLELLKQDGAKVAAFDVMFNEASRAAPNDDELFSRKLRESGNVLLPITFSEKTILDNDSGEIATRTVPARAVEIIRNAVAGEGFIDVENRQFNQDGVIRQLFLDRKVNDTVYYHMALLAASKFWNQPIVKQSGGFALDDRFLPIYTRNERTRPEGPVSSFLLNYAGPACHFNEMYYSEALTNPPPGAFKNKIAVIGFRAKGSSPDDLKVSPFGVIAGVEVHANLLNNILMNRFLKRFSPLVAAAMIFSIVLFLAYILWRKRGWIPNTISLALFLGWLALGYGLFFFDRIIELAPVIVMVPCQWAVTRLLQQFYDLRKRNMELAKKVRELSLVNEVSQAVNFMGDLSKTLDAILSRAVQALSAERGSIFLLDERYENLIEESIVFGIDGPIRIDPALKGKFKIGEGVAGEVFQKGSTRMIQDLSREPDLIQFFASHPTVKSMICVPLKVRDAPIGVLNIVNKNESAFDQEDLQLALTMANQAAVVIEKARLFNLATIDGLTGLVVHRHFQSKLEEEFRRGKRYEKPLSLIMTDIDHFKKFNDTWGHQIGDLVLREVAKCVQSTIRDTDIAARYGGEEFAIVLPETDEVGARLLAERLRQKVEGSVFPGPKGDLRVAISLGVSSIPLNPAETTAEMIKLADEALYAAKHGGRNQVRVSELRAAPAEPFPQQ